MEQGAASMDFSIFFSIQTYILPSGSLASGCAGWKRDVQVPEGKKRAAAWDAGMLPGHMILCLLWIQVWNN